jgi:hypothetical protein
VALSLRKLKRILEERFPPPDNLDLRDEDGIIGVITSRRFRGLDSMQRQNVIHDILASGLTAEEWRDVVLGAVTPEEGTADAAADQEKTLLEVSPPLGWLESSAAQPGRREAAGHIRAPVAHKTGDYKCLLQMRFASRMPPPLCHFSARGGCLPLSSPDHRAGRAGEFPGPGAPGPIDIEIGPTRARYCDACASPWIFLNAAAASR